MVDGKRSEHFGRHLVPVREGQLDLLGAQRLDDDLGARVRAVDRVVHVPLAHLAVVSVDARLHQVADTVARRVAVLQNVQDQRLVQVGELGRVEDPQVQRDRAFEALARGRRDLTQGE
jgi:hypothetical protein